MRKKALKAAALPETVRSAAAQALTLALALALGAALGTVKKVSVLIHCRELEGHDVIDHSRLCPSLPVQRMS